MAAIKTPVAGNASLKPAGFSRPGPLLASVLDRGLPNSPEAEQAVLGAMLLKPREACPTAMERLTDQHFYSVIHQVLFREIIGMFDKINGADMITLTQRLSDKNLLAEIGGPVVLHDLLDRTPTAANVEHYVNIVWEKHLLRQMIGTAQDIVGRCFEQQDDVTEWVDEVEQQMFAITAERTTTGAKAMRDLIKDAMGSIEQISLTHGGPTGLTTGFRELDKMTSGLIKGNMIVIAARPSVGKTALAMNIAEHVSVDRKTPVGVFSLEMSADELVKRMLCSRARVNLRALRDGFLGEKDHVPLVAAADELMKAPLYIDDAAGLSIQQVRAKARRMKLQYDIQLLVVDYLQLLRAPSRRADMNRQVEIADISMGIKALAKELSIPIIILSQLNRQPEQREGGKPRLSDLRESGAIEQDADVVGLLVRPEMYEDDAEQKSAKEGEATLIIAKQRNGPTGDVNLTFLKEYTRFEDRAKIDADDMPGGGRRDE